MRNFKFCFELYFIHKYQKNMPTDRMTEGIFFFVGKKWGSAYGVHFMLKLKLYGKKINLT